MVIVAVKKYCRKGNKTYGPYPKNPEIFYLYRVYWEGDKIKLKMAEVIMREIKRDETRLAKYLGFLERHVVQEKA